MSCSRSQASAREESRAASRRERNLRALRRFRPIDDTFMRVMFQGQLALAQEVLRIITGIDDLVLLGEETQRDVAHLGGSRTVCLDVYGEDSEGRKYDLEVQRDDSGASAKRARYHSAAIDVDSLGAGESFDELPETYVIFLTERDVMGAGVGLYRFERQDLASGLELGDGSHVIYADASHEAEGALGDLMHDFMCSNPDEMRNEAMAYRVRYLKENEEGAEDMCKIMDELREESREEGREETKVHDLKALMEELKVSAERAMDLLRVPAADRPRYLAML